MARPASTTTVPGRVGFVGAWIDPQQRRVWSGVPTGLRRGLAALDRDGGYYDATPPRGPTKLARALATRRGAAGGLWTLSPEMRLVTGLSNLAHRRRSRGRAEVWINATAGFGRPVSGEVAALVELSPHQLAWVNEHHPGASWPPLSPRRLRAMCRQQLRLLDYAAVICTASGWAQDSLVRDHGIDPARIRVVGYGRNIDIPPPPRKDWTSPRYLFVGRDWERKNGDAVVRAFRRIRAEHPDARLDVEGGHPRMSVDGVVCHGSLDLDEPDQRARFESLFQQATCFVMPSHVEAFGIVHVEAAAAGVPSIGTTVGGTADSVGDGGRCVDPADDDALVDAMRELARPEVARSLGDAALARSGDYTWTEVARRVLEAVDQRALA